MKGSKMGKMKKLYTMAMKGEKDKIKDYLETKMSKGAANIGAIEFIKAANQIKEESKNAKS